MTKPPPGLSRFDMSAFLAIAWGGVVLGAVFTAFGVIAAVQSRSLAPRIDSVIAVLIGFGGWYNVRLTRN